MEQIRPTDKICYNCKYLAWLIGVGQGLRCGHPDNRQDGNNPPLVPGRFHTCNLFEFKVGPKSKKSKNT